MNDIFIRYTDELPLSVLGLTKPDSNGDYNVYINSRVSKNKQSEAIHHELKHIWGNDFDRGITATEIEKECDKIEQQTKIFHLPRQR